MADNSGLTFGKVTAAVFVGTLAAALLSSLILSFAVPLLTTQSAPAG
jgi:hypothetical protein